MNAFQLSIPRPKPRNPVAVKARLRRAGAHRCSASTDRQKAQRDLRREFAESNPPPGR